VHGNVGVDLTSAQDVLSQILLEVVPPEELACLTQKMISFKVDSKLKLSLANSLTYLRNKARMASLVLAHSGDLLNVVPSPILGLHIRPHEFRYPVLHRLGASVFPSSGPCPAFRRPSDNLGDHTIVCDSQGPLLPSGSKL
jgi:hypothetical protein